MHVDDIDAVDPSPYRTALLVELVGNPLALAQLRMSAKREVGHERNVATPVAREDAVV